MKDILDKKLWKDFWVAFVEYCSVKQICKRLDKISKDNNEITR